MVRVLGLAPEKITDVLQRLEAIGCDFEGDAHPLLEGLTHGRFLVLLRRHEIVNGGE